MSVVSYMRLLLLIPTLLLCHIMSSAQSETLEKDIVFAPFEGKVYKMPIVEKRRGNLVTKRLLERFDPGYTEYPFLTEIKLSKLNVPETTMGLGEFPGVPAQQGFCMMLHSKMKVATEGCYEFKLKSDDGSILWIDDQMAVNNDGGHQMRLQVDSIGLAPGLYDIRLWYFQGMPDRFGLQFNADKVGELMSCDNELSKQEDSFVINSSLLFSTASYELSTSAYDVLKSFCNEHLNDKTKYIKVIGHTDSVGEEQDNMELSMNRANAVKAALQDCVSSELSIEVLGKGEIEPIADNDTRTGRAKNRRVEIILDK